MIPILYSENETNFNHNGLGLLVDTIYCYPEETRNGAYELELAYPVNSAMYKEIKANKWIKAKVNDRFEQQLFRIYYISKPINGKITVKAEHISYLLKDNFVESFNITSDCNGVLNALNNSATFATGFNFYSDVVATRNFSFDLRNFWECIIGKGDSIVSQFGTGMDIVRDNKNISLLNNCGQDNNVLIAYKKNLTGFTLEEDWTNTITKIYPYATQNNVRIILPEKYINSQYINRDPNPRVQAIDFTNQFAEGVTITADALRQKAINYFINTQCDIPSLNYNIEFVALSKTEEYKNSALNESISLFDYVIIRHELYGIDTKIKVIKTKYDSLSERYLKIELGFVKNTITSVIKNTNQKIDDTKTELTKDITDAITKASDAISDLTTTMGKSDSDILLEVHNNKSDADTKFEMQDGLIAQTVTQDEFGSYKTQTATEIAQRVKNSTYESYIDETADKIATKVAKDDFSSLVEQNYDSVAIAIKSQTDMNVLFDSAGQTIKNGALVIKDSNGNIVMQFNKVGIAHINDIELGDTAKEKGSMFYNGLANMEEVRLEKLTCGTLYLEGIDMYDYIVNVLKDKGLV